MASEAINLYELGKLIREFPITVADIKHVDLWGQAAKILEGQAKDCFAFSRSPEGTPWSPLKHNRPRGGSKPLLDTGVLRASLVGRAAGHIERVTPTSLEWGTNVLYAYTHQYGAVITPKKGKYLALPVSIEAQRVGSPRKFPGAKVRLGWIIGKRGGIVYEKPGMKKAKGPAATRGAKKKKSRFGKLMKKLKRGFKKAKKVAITIAKLSLRLSKYVQKLKKTKAGTAQFDNIMRQIHSLKKKIKTLKAKKDKPAKGKKAPRGRVTTVVNGVEVLVHYILTKQVIVPPRPFLGFSVAAADLLSELISNFIIETMIRKGYDKMK